MSEEEMASTPGRMSKDVAESPVRPRKITLADFISEKRTNPHVNFNLNSRTLTPHSCVTSVHGSTYDNDTHSSNTDKPTSTTSNQRDSSRTCSSGDEDEDEKEDDGKKTRPKRAVFACDGHGKRESRWKSESIRRIRLSTLIQKSRESSAKTARASELDLFNDSRSGYSLDMVSRPSTRYPPTSGESKRSRRDRVSRGDNRHTSHSHHLPDVHRQTRKRRQSLGESRGCQTSPILYHKINDNKQVTEEVKSQPITEVDDEFDYPLSQLLLEYPYNPKTKEKETKTSETGTEIALTDLQEVRRSQTIGIDIHSSNDGGKRIYDADGTIIIVTASSVINAGETVTRTDKRDNRQGIDASERSKPDTSSETKDQSNVNDKPISNNTSTPNTDSHNNNQFENTCETQEPEKGLSCSNFAATSNAKIDSSTVTTANNALSDRVDESTDLSVPHGTLNSLEQEHISDGTTQIDKSEEMDPTGNLPGKDCENSPNIETSNETSSSINSNVAPTSEKDTSVELQLKTDNNVDRSPQDKDESVEPSTNENEINESSLESDQASSGNSFTQKQQC
ncbi:serine-rich adhesin for platelets-like [Pecten maximus]|uniref:serine-rich adhesin for platelets-like n=1 Tax=Pecten maximus TaxID=6579 RepID=UPI001458A1CA|nr:serine-rich adhesin for platelets-like [Pecten maximus]